VNLDFIKKECKVKRENASNTMLILICAVLLSSYLCFAKAADESKIIKYQYVVNSVRFSPDGKYLAIAGGQSILLYDMERNKIARHWKLNFWIYAMDFAPDSEQIAVGGTSLDTLIYKIKARRPSKHINSGKVIFLDFSPDGKWLAARSMSKPSITVFDLTNNKKTTLKLFAGPSWWPSPRILFSPNSKLFAVAGDPVIMWQVGSWKEIGKLGKTDMSIAFSSTSLTLAQGTFNGNGEIIFWRTSTGTKRLSFQSENIKYSTYIDFSPGGHYLAVAGGPDRNAAASIIEIWKMNKQRVIKIFKGHTGMITTLDFSPDGKWLASGSYDQTVRLWDISPIADPAPKSVDATDKIATTWGQIK